MHYFARYLTILLTLSALVTNVQAVSPSLVVSELQTGTAASAGEELVELYNPTSVDVSLSGWSVEYKSATSLDQPSSWSQRASLTGTIKAHGFYLIAPSTYLAQADADLSAGMAAGGGHVRLTDSTGTVIDRLGWGTANSAEATPAPAPAAGQSLERKPGRLNEGGGNATDSDNNAADFLLRTLPAPQSSASALEAPSDTTTMPEAETGLPAEDDSLPGDQTYFELEITELFINPATPLTDASDEFIELYNPNQEPVDYQGYVLRTGSNFHDHYTLPAGTIPAGGYAVLYSSQTHLSLTNGGGAAQLLDPAGKIVTQTSLYPEADEGVSWAKFDSAWEWTLQLTPGRANILVKPLLASDQSAAAASAKKSAAKTGAKATVAKAAKPKSPKAAAKPKATKIAAAKKATAPTVAGAVASAGSTPGAKWLLLAAVGLTMGYAIYEFRTDLQNYYYLARRKLAAWVHHRPGS